MNSKSEKTDHNTELDNKKSLSLSKDRDFKLKSKTKLIPFDELRKSRMLSPKEIATQAKEVCEKNNLFKIKNYFIKTGIIDS